VRIYATALTLSPLGVSFECHGGKGEESDYRISSLPTGSEQSSASRLCWSRPGMGILGLNEKANGWTIRSAGTLFRLMGILPK
jgi:hypothetical protein